MVMDAPRDNIHANSGPAGSRHHQPGHPCCAAAVLRMSGLRPTRQRVGLISLLLGDGHRHVSAEDIVDEARQAGLKVSVATVYNALRQFRAVGLVRELPIEGMRSLFDTNAVDHHHFYLEDECRLVDIDTKIGIAPMPTPPLGMIATGIDVVVRVRRQTVEGVGRTRR